MALGARFALGGLLAVVALLAPVARSPLFAQPLPRVIGGPLSPADSPPPPEPVPIPWIGPLKRFEPYPLPSLKLPSDEPTSIFAEQNAVPTATPPLVSPLPDPAALEPLPGRDRKLNVSWDNGGFRFRSADDVFNLHMGGRLMTDQVWFNQSPNLRLPPTQPPGASGVPQTGVGQGIGDLTDGAFARRARFVADGTIFKTIDFKVEFDFENYNSIAFDESFVGVRDLPYVGMVRVGQTHVPFGLEAYTSSRFLPLLERSPLYDAFYQEFAPGIFVNTTFQDQRITMQHMFHRIDNFSQFNGASFGDGKYAYTGRVSVLPVYEDGGNNLLHLGLAYQIRKGSGSLDFNGGASPGSDFVRFRARQSLRDAVGLQGDPIRIVDTGNIVADHVQGLNAEFLWYRGPFWVQSEGSLAHVDNAVIPVTNTVSRRGDLNFWGAYMETGYLLTGETRGYDKPMGKYGRVVPNTNFFLARDKAGNIRTGPGAWECIYRYSYVGLNDNTIQGGAYGEHTWGVNWYWNSNIKLQVNYLIGQRIVPSPDSSGIVQGFGFRGSLEF